MNTYTKVEEVKNSVRIEDVVGRHIVLKPSGKNFVGCCPFHEDQKPSFTVYPETKSWYCFGCGKGGDVFKFLQDSNGGDFSTALKEVALIGGMRLSDNEDLSDYAERRKLEEIRLATVNYYHQFLFNEKGEAALDYLVTERGLQVALIKDFRLGYAPIDKSSLNHYLTGKGFSAELGIKAGVLAPDKTDYFHEYIVFPNIINGRVVTFQGRAFPEHKPKYKLESGPIDWLIGETALNCHKEVLVVEGWPDFLTLQQAGYENVVGIYGVSGFKKEGVLKFNGVKTVYLALDGDNPGKERALKIAGFFENCKALVVSFPEVSQEGGVFTKDWNDLFVKIHHGDTVAFRKQVDGCLDKAGTRLDLKIEAIKNLSGTRRLPAVKDLLPELWPLSPIERDGYIGKISNELSVSKRSLRKELSGLEEKFQAEKQQNADIEEKVELTPEERERAEALLQNPLLLNKLFEATRKEGCVGEEHILRLIYLVLTSRLLRKPIALVLKGESSIGKSFLVTLVSTYLPEPEIKVVTRMTTNALYYLPKGLKHKALIVQENPGTKDADYSLRIMQSEGFVAVMCAMKDEKTGRMITVENKVEGPIAYIETTTRARLFAENETRVFSAYLDDSPEQTEAIITTQAEMAKFGKFQGKEEGDAVRKDFINAQTLLEKYEVRIPYAPLLVDSFPTEKIRARRDHPRVHALIEASALLHQYQREKGRDGETEYLVANIDDYRVAYDLVPHVLREAVQGRSKKSDELLGICNNFVNGKQPEFPEPNEFTRADLIKETSWSAPTIIGCLKELQDNGYIEQPRTGTHNAYVYELTDRGRNPESKSLNFLPTPEEVERAMTPIKV